MSSPEHDQQAALFAWANARRGEHPALRYLFAVPNGGLRAKVTAMRLKAEGVKAGVPDVWLPYPCGPYHGLIIEMKAGRNKPTPEQREWLAFLTAQGYKTAVCWSWLQAACEVRDYLGLPVATFPELEDR